MTQNAQAAKGPRLGELGRGACGRHAHNKRSHARARRNWWRGRAGAGGRTHPRERVDNIASAAHEDDAVVADEDVADHWRRAHPTQRPL